MKEKFKPCQLSQLHTAGQSPHAVGVNVGLSVLESYRNCQTQLPHPSGSESTGVTSTPSFSVLVLVSFKLIRVGFPERCLRKECLILVQTRQPQQDQLKICILTWYIYATSVDHMNSKAELKNIYLIYVLISSLKSTELIIIKKSSISPNRKWKFNI